MSSPRGTYTIEMSKQFLPRASQTFSSKPSYYQRNSLRQSPYPPPSTLVQKRCSSILITSSSTSNPTTSTTIRPQTPHIPRPILSPTIPYSSSRPVSYFSRTVERSQKIGGTFRFSINSVLAKELTELGINEILAWRLIVCARVRSPDPRGARYVYDCIRNRELWLRHPSRIPRTHGFAWQSHLAAEDAHGGGLKGLPLDLSLHTIGAAYRAIGRSILIRNEVDQNLNMIEVNVGCFIMELAVLCGQQVAAAELMNYVNDPEKAVYRAEGKMTTSTVEAERVIAEVKNRPSECPWQVIVTYMKEEYGLPKLGRHSAAQFEWAIAILREAAPQINCFVNDPHEPSFVRYEHPCKTVLRIIDHCWNKRILLPSLQQDLRALREQCLFNLVILRDPDASMIVCLRGDTAKVGSQEWVALMTSAAAEGNKHACWLLAIDHMQKESLLPVKTNSSDNLQQSLGIEFARISVMASADAPRDMHGRAFALAALIRASGDYAEGLRVLDEAYELATQNPRFPRNELTALERSIEEYTDKDETHLGFWSSAKMERAIQGGFDLDHTLNDAKQMFRWQR